MGKCNSGTAKLLDRGPVGPGDKAEVDRMLARKGSPKAEGASPDRNFFVTRRWPS